MTVIFHTNAKAPALAGDMLLSDSGPNVHTELKLPSQPRGITIPSSEIPSLIPVNMRRKIFIVNDRMAIGAAGSVPHLRGFIEDMGEEFSDRGDFSYAEIRSALDKYASSQIGKKALKEIEALILVEASGWRGSLTCGLSSRRDLVSDGYGRVVAIGAGSDNIIDQVNRLDNWRYGMSQPPDGEVEFPEFVTLARNLTLLANLYWREFAQPEGIFDAWGGAYDLIYQDSKKTFRYLSEYTIFLRQFDVDRSDEDIRPMNVLKYERRPEVSLITMINDGELDFFGAKDITASEEPLQVTVGGNEFTMNSKIHISIIAIGKGTRFVPMIQIDGLGPGEKTNQTVFTWFDEEGKLCIAFHAQHDEWLKDQAMSFYQRHASRWA